MVTDHKINNCSKSLCPFSKRLSAPCTRTALNPPCCLAVLRVRWSSSYTCSSVLSYPGCPCDTLTAICSQSTQLSQQRQVHPHVLGPQVMHGGSGTGVTFSAGPRPHQSRCCWELTLLTQEKVQKYVSVINASTSMSSIELESPDKPPTGAKHMLVHVSVTGPDI